MLQEKAARRKRVEQTEERDEYYAAVPGQAVGTVAAILPGSLTLYFQGEYIVVPAKGHHKMAVGDKVSFPPESPENFRGPLKRQGVIARLHGDSTRRDGTKLHRQLVAANVDYALIVASVAEPPFHPRFVDRYLVIAQMGGVAPALILNKADLTAERHPHLEAFRSIGLPIIETSATEHTGLDEVRDLIRNRTAVLVGNSGVGKSALTSALLPDVEIRTQEISARTGKGQHTTTTTHLYEWAPGSFIIDTPGIRTLGLNSIPPQDLAAYFPEFAPFANLCRFANCTHSHEPGCAVQSAVESNEINHLRYDSYLRLMAER